MDELKRIDRRSILRAGMLGATGLALPHLLRMEAHAAQQGKPTKKASSVIILWMRGGPSHIDMWDPKPDAPAEYRGEFGAIPTNVPGIRLADMLPMSAAIMDKWSIVRSLHHHDAGHSDRRPDLLHRLHRRAATPTRTSTRAAARSSPSSSAT